MKFEPASERSHERDRESIGLNPQSVQIIDQLVDELEWFAEAQDAARLALAYAVRAGIGEGSAANTETRWSAGLFDRTGEIRATVLGLYPECSTPVRQMEYLVNEGLRLMKEQIQQGDAAPYDFLG